MEIPLLITSAARPSAGFTKLQSQNERIKYTFDSLKVWISLGIRQIVVCDGTGVNLESYADPRYFGGDAVRIEWLAFNNDITLVASRGKGYGEGEIIQYALKNSNIIKSSLFFAKCTGKLWVENYFDILQQFNGVFLSDVNGVLRPFQADTRFYVTSTQYYNKWLRHCFENVYDSKGYYLEHAFFDQIKKSGIKNWISSPSMRTVGVSGTSNIFQKRTNFKSLIRDIRNFTFRSIY